MEQIYLTIAIKLLSGFIIVIIYINLSGKGALAPISSLDQVGNIVLGAIIGGPLYNPQITVYMMTGVACTWAGLLLLVRYLTFKRSEVKNIVDGKAVCLMRNSELIPENFTKAKLATRDFIMLLHQRGYNNLDELQSVWFEYNGQLSVTKKGDDSMATVLIENGQIDANNLERIGLQEETLLADIKEQKYTLEDIFIGEWHSNKLWIYPKVQPRAEQD